MFRELATINPRKLGGKKKSARKSSKSRVTVRVEANPRPKKRKRKHRVRVHTNPRFSLKLGKLKGIVAPIIPAAIGGAGALATDVALGYLLSKANLSPQWQDRLKAGPWRLGARLALAFGIGFAAKKFAPKYASQVMAGALTVTAYDELRKLTAKQFPDLVLGCSEYAGDLSAYRWLSGYNALPVLKDVHRGGVNAYVSPSELGMIPVVR